MSYEILADMSIDIDMQIAEDNHVRLIPMKFILGEDEIIADRVQTNEEMHAYYEKLRQQVPTSTSQITPSTYIQFFEPYLKEKKSILYIGLSGGLSATMSSAKMAVDQLKVYYPNAEIELVDSFGATGGQGLLTEKAIEMRDAGKSLEETAAWLREHVTNVNYWFKVEDLMYLKRGGRISATSAVVATALNIKPILHINAQGKLDTLAKKRGEKQALKYIVERFAETYDPSFGNVVYICCADCMDAANKLKEMVLEVQPNLTVRTTMLSPVIGAHTGPDMYALIHFGRKR